MRPILRPMIFVLLLLAGLALAAERRFSPSGGQMPPRDGRAGTVVDVQGTATARVAGGRRWTPLRTGGQVWPAEVVRTSARGANAVELELRDGAQVLVGPGATIELGEATASLRLLRGQVEVTPAEGAPLSVRGPGGFAQRLTERAVLAATAASTEQLTDDPRWLTGYRGAATNEWMGSLVAQVDGRDVPLSIGYHKVDVEIKDQIARTTVEQSFVNNTDARLEGVFYFPLPSDASVSGFGMWIGSELVEADVVERQRARAIFEDIVRRRKDPALLEWAGGNLFKARVFPIEAHSEKRIRIRYTQVLPLRGDTLRYRYALRSDLLRAHPLRQLQLRVAIDSATAITAIESPTHEVRSRDDGHRAAVEFDAEDYVPQRDFEVAVRLARRDPLSLRVHRRGDDGYLMALLSAPEDTGVFRRERIGDASMGELVVVADTSASMDHAARAAQHAFVEGLLSVLGEDDRFRLYAGDVEAVPFAAAASAPTDANVGAAMEFLTGRASLGWSDVEAMLRRAIGDASAGAVVVYVGDGLGTAADSDAVALAERLAAAGAGADVACHAVSTGAQVEARVLQAIAAIGGGSVRAVGQHPALDAAELLEEATSPAVRELSLRFEGLETARVHPGRLANLAAGSQHVVVGRYRPGEESTAGRLVVEGTRDGVPVRWVADVELPAADGGNSFIPRLWARRHIDALLLQGRAPGVAEDIIELSERYGVITPYTSLLVLENDADRERYGVERRVHPRDGEQFFAAARDAVDLAMRRDQMRAARAWRHRLRAQMLREIAGLGRDLSPWHVAVGTSAEGKFGGGGARYARDFDNEQLDSVRFASARGPMTAAPFDDERSAEELETPLPASESMANLPGASADSFFLGDQRRSAAMAPPASGGRWRRDANTAWGPVPPRADLGSLGFPPLPPAAPIRAPVAAPAAWPEEVRRVLLSLDRSTAVAARTDGLRWRGETTRIHALRRGVVGVQRSELLVLGHEWHARSAPRAGLAYESWNFAGFRAALSADLALGRRRPSAAADADAWPRLVGDASFTDWSGAYAGWKARLLRADDDVAVVELVPPEPRTDRTELVVDVRRAVLRERRVWTGDALTQRATFGDFVEVGGVWWATHAESFDGEGRRVMRQSIALESVPAADAAAQLAARAAPAGALLLDGPAPSLAVARRAVHEGRGRPIDVLTVALHFAARQSWDECRDAMAPLLAGSEEQSAEWLRFAAMALGRRGAELSAQAERVVSAAAARLVGRGAVLGAHVLQVASRHLEPPEVLALVEALRPAFADAGPDTDFAERQLRDWQAKTLERAGRWADALVLRRALLADASGEPTAVWECARALMQCSRTGEAAQLLQAALDARKRLTAHEANDLYTRCTELLWSRRDGPALLALTETWIGEHPTRAVAADRYIAARYLFGAEDAADAWVAARLAEAPRGADAGDDVRRAHAARLHAAVSIVLGRGWNFGSYAVDLRFADALRAAVLPWLDAGAPYADVAARVLRDYRFARTDAGAALRDEVRGRLLEDRAIATMPLPRLQLLLAVLEWQADAVDVELRASLVALLHARWRAEPEAGAVLARELLRIHDAGEQRAEALAVARQWLLSAAAETRAAAAAALLPRLLREPWSRALEDEALATLAAHVSPKAEAAARDGAIAGAVRQLATGLLEQRRRHALGEPAALEALSRAARREAERNALAAARAGLAERLARAAEEADPAHRAFLAVEALCFAVETGADLADVDRRARALLAELSGEDAAAEGAVEEAPERPTAAWRRALRERCSLVLSHAACQTAAPEPLVDGVIALYRAGVAAESGDLDWRYQLWRLLLALDRPEPLEAVVRTWLTPADVHSPWRVALAYLLAERGALRDAVRELERVAEAGALEAAEFEAMAGWQLALGDLEARKRAVRQRFATMPEHELIGLLQRARQSVARRGAGVPGDLDAQVFRALPALLRKAGDPAAQLWLVENLYAAVKDHRLLQATADGLLGHSPQTAYAMLERVGRLIAQVHEEATCDAVVERIESLLAADPNAADRRALTMLGFLVERRASEVLDAPGPHADRGLRWLRDSARGDWAPGEPPMMATLLAGMGVIADRRFADEQRRQLRELERVAQRDLGERLAVALSLGRTEWAYGAQDAAIDGVRAALAAYRTAPRPDDIAAVNEALATLSTWYQSRGRFRVAEDLLVAELDRDVTEAQRTWLQLRRFELWVGCLGQGGAVALGRGADLYRGARAAMQDALFSMPVTSLREGLTQFLLLHGSAHREASVGGVAADLQRFAATALPELATRAAQDSQALFVDTAGTLAGIAGPHAGLRLLLHRIETEPRWLARVRRGGWQTFAGTMARWRQEQPELGDLEPRLLRVVMDALVGDLTGLDSRQRSMYGRGSYVWKEKADLFARRALEIAAAAEDSVARQRHVADYLWHGLQRYADAIDLLRRADARAPLSGDALRQLMHWLQDRRQWEASVALARRLVDEFPDRVDDRVRLVRGLHETGADEAARGVLDATVERLERVGRWDEGAMAAVAQVALRCEFWRRAAELFDAAIAAHERGQRPNANTLSNYYGSLALARAALGQDAAAVDAAAAAVVAWSGEPRRRGDALQKLHAVLAKLSDLAGYVRGWDAEVAARGVDAPVIRKALGEVYRERGELATAARQLELARALQPEDVEVHDALIGVLEAMGDPAAACEAMRIAAAHDPTALPRFVQLGTRYAALGQGEASERAFTSLVEVLPEEAAGHRLLALQREQQARHLDALRQWRCVVRIRTDEPEGWLGVARMQRATGDEAAAKKTLQHVLDTEWDERFGAVHVQARALLDRGSKR